MMAHCHSCQGEPPHCEAFQARLRAGRCRSALDAVNALSSCCCRSAIDSFNSCTGCLRAFACGAGEGEREGESLKSCTGCPRAFACGAGQGQGEAEGESCKSAQAWRVKVPGQRFESNMTAGWGIGDHDSGFPSPSIDRFCCAGQAPFCFIVIMKNWLLPSQLSCGLLVHKLP